MYSEQAAIDSFSVDGGKPDTARYPTDLKTNRAPHWWSWADIVRHANELGIPNFQRGAVWDKGNCVALLESIYEQSPCGSFVLWAPDNNGRDPRRHGVPLLRFAHGKDPMWLVDGQQRTRAMLDTFKQLINVPSRPDGWSLVREADLAALRTIGASLLGASEEQGDEIDEDAGDDLYPWLAVLPAMPVFDRGRKSYFGRHSESRNVRRGAMFRRLRPRARIRLNEEGKSRTMPPHPLGLVPLVALLSPVGVLHDSVLRNAAWKALQTFDTDDADLSGLDDLLPWGPQFVTGYAYEISGQGPTPAVPILWADLKARRQEAGVREMVDLLAGLFTPVWAAVFKRFAGMLDGNRFAVGWLPPSDVSDAIDAYVRINRAGIRVRDEERALALLSRARPNLLDDLADYTRQRDGGDLIEDQRALLVHESDRQMGFSVWITAVTRYTTLAILGVSGRRWLALSAIDKDTFGYRLDRVGPDETEIGKKTWARSNFATPEEVIRECSEKATPALLLIESVLSGELHLDHRMARPPARALYPLIDLFYRVPAAELGVLHKDRAFRSAIARLLHWTLLAPYIDQPDLEKLIVEVHGIDESVAYKESSPLKPWDGHRAELHECLRSALWRYQASLLTIWCRKRDIINENQHSEPLGIDGLPVYTALNRLALDAFTSEVRNARSLQHPAVGWLYALERRGNAREFDWDAQQSGYSDSGGKRGVPKPPVEGPTAAMKLQRGRGFASPEKQHIVPFTVARQIVDKGGTRATASPSNAIGNLTWLSQRQNGLDGLADRWTVMDRQADADNLAARGMLATVVVDGTERTVIDVYEELSHRVLAGTESWRADREGTLRLFAAFCDGRAAWIVDQMRLWLEETLPVDTAAWLGEVN
jgi:hypothetical protein